MLMDDWRYGYWKSIQINLLQLLLNSSVFHWRVMRLKIIDAVSRCLAKCSVLLFRESVSEAGAESATELAGQQGAVDMSMVSTGEQHVMIISKISSSGILL